MGTRRRHRRARLLVVALVIGMLVTLAVLGGTASGARKANVTITLDTLPIANGFALDLGIQKGFFDKQGIDIKKQVFQSGNDIVVALANHTGDIGYIGYVPAMIGRTQGIPFTVIAASDDEGASEADNWQNIMVRSGSSIRTPADLAGKTIAVNALKGVGEVIIKAALKKKGVNPDSVKLVAIPFPAMRAALNGGQIDAMWAPEPFVTQVLADGGRVVLAPGPAVGKYFPNGCYGALHDYFVKNPGIVKRFRTAMNQSLLYAQNHPQEIRAFLPAATQNIRLPVWSPLIDRKQLLTLARYAKEFGVIPTLPNFTQLVPGTVKTGKPVVKKKKKKK